jgi:anti-sigma regulatory factor (Ser/Thr protein kinase)
MAIHCIPITEASQVAAVRRTALQMAHYAELSEPETGALALVATEAATNLVKHAQAGRVLLRALDEAEGPGVELLALDTGPGMAQVEQCLQDGYSTAGSPGTGLGAITRLATLWDLYSVPGRGTALLARVVHRAGVVPTGRQPRRSASVPLAVGVVCVPYPGETVCGDAWMVAQQAERCLVLVADGLGHGLAAADAAYAVVQACRQHCTRTPEELLATAHAAAQGTRGAAVGIAEINVATRVIRFAGVGNIAGVVWTAAGSRGMASHNGIVGHDMRRRQMFTYPWSPDAVVVLHSDGLQSRWRLDAYPDLARRHPSLIAGVLYRDFTRERDDVTVLAVAAVPPWGARTLPREE